MVWSAAVLGLLALNAWATLLVLRDVLSSIAQRIAQLAIVWFFPVLGAVLTIVIKKQSVPRGRGRYREEPEPPDDFGYSGRGPRNGRNRHDEETPPAPPDAD